MTTSTRRFRKWTVAAAGALTLGLMGLAGPASFAAPTPIVNLDPDAIGSITVTKVLQPTPPGTSPDGTAQDTTGLTPVAGVTFQIQEVTHIGGVAVDFTTEASWLAAEALNPANTAGYTVGTVLDTDVTDAAGVLTFGNLPVGLYLITETAAPPEITTFAAPFLVSIPLPLPPNNVWLYDVFVYPKNSTATVDKSVDDDDAVALGDEITWTLYGGIPALPEGRTLSAFVIEDTLDPRLEYVPNSAVVTGVDNAGALLALMENVDYTIDFTDPLLTVEFTADGLAKLSAAGVGGPNAKVTLEFDTVVIGPIGDGTIENTGVFTIGGASFEDTATSDWGALKIYKYAAPNTAAALAGAEFSVYASAADAAAGTNPISVLVPPAPGTPTTVFTTGTDGTVVIPGLTPGTYYVKEVKPPAGYLANTTVYPVTVTVGSIELAVVQQVPNTQVPPIDLPLTGANGTILFSLAGLGLMAVAGGTALKHRSRTIDAR